MYVQHVYVIHYTWNIFNNLKICIAYDNGHVKLFSGFDYQTVNEELCLTLSAANSRGCGVHMIWDIQFSLDQAEILSVLWLLHNTWQFIVQFYFRFY